MCRGHGTLGSSLTLGSGEVDDISVLLEHVNLLDGRNGLGVELLQRRVKLLVISTRPLGSSLDRSPGSSFAAKR